jgi:DNA-binding winged helix-turn-helix (wHTH) protein
VSLVSFGSHLFDSARCMLLRDGQAVPLTRKAFLLLELLIQRRPAVVSKKQILETLWPDCFVEEGNVASLISEIRGALDVGGQAGMARSPGSAIRTVHGVGYAFAAVTGQGAAPLRPVALEAPRALLIEKGPPPRDIELAEGISTLGRGVTCQVRATSATVSRNHARIEIAAGHATLEDLGSHNGTFLRGRRISAPVALASGDDIRLGKVEFVFRLEAAAEGETVSVTSERR